MNDHPATKSLDDEPPVVREPEPDE